MNILDLPPELLTVCFSYLKGPDLAKAAQTSSLFNEIASIEKLWQDICLEEYGLPIDTRLKVSFKETYGKVLYKYGRLIGLWRNKTTGYGGLVHIWYTDEGDILAEEFCGQKNVHEQLLRNPVFHIIVDAKNNIQQKWLATCTDPEPCEIHQDQEKRAVRADCERRGTHRQLCMYRWQSYKENRCKQHFERIDPALFKPVHKVPIQPGLFKGMYGGHGTELVHLFYDFDGSNGRCGQAKKITGDPNVPSGEISIRFYLNKHMFLYKEQQQLKSLKLDEDDETKHPYDPEKPCRQPFVIPSDVLMDNTHAVCPKYCIGRFHGKGTVSPMGYSNPTLISTHVVVFDENLFGVLWMDLQSFSLFSRVKETFSALR